jgi:hypothetical protein
VTKLIALSAQLTAEDIERLRATREFVRVNFAHAHTWAERDAVLATFDKLFDEIAKREGGR